jgi:hypothetical protein
MRQMGNNYNEALFYLLSTLPLTFNDNTTDDPPLSNTCGATRYQVCSDGTAGSMHAYFHYFVGTILYMTYAHMEDPTVSVPAYQRAYGNLPATPTCVDWRGGSEIGNTLIPCFGDGRGGESSEGNGYGYSVGSIRSAMNAIWTAGYADPLIYGPQMSLATSSWWDLHNIVTNEFLTGMEKNNGGTSGRSPSYGVINTGDENSYQTYPNNLGANTSTMVFDTYTGRTDRMSSLEWPVLNTAYGGPAGNLLGCVDYCGFDEEMTVQIANGVASDFFIALPAGDPVASPPPDPRPSMPLDLWNGSYNQHQMVRTGFTPTDTLLSITCGNTLIDHEHGDCGRIEIYSGNEWITKGRNTFNDYNSQMSAATQNNELAVLGGQPNCGTSSSDPDWYWACATGGTWGGGEQAGLVTPLHSELPIYAANITDMRSLYNQWPFSTNVTGASRSILFLKGTKQVVFYDVATTTTSLDKSVYMNTTGIPTIAGNVASWLTQSGTQKVYLTTLLPSTTGPANIGLTPGNSEQAADWEVVTTLKIDGGSTTSNQFLHVLEWGGSSFTKTPTALVQSTSGMGFDGALVGTSLVMFMRNWPTAFTTVTYPASGATNQYVSNLIPSHTYNIVGNGAPTTATTDVAGVLAFAATGTGNIIITDPDPTPGITSALTTNGIVGVPFSYQITATNSPTSYGATNLPAGLSVDPIGGSISGTPTTAGSSSIVLSATNASGTGSATLTLQINAAGGGEGTQAPLPVITSSATATATVGVPFSYQITAVNNPTSYYALGVPGGLSFDPTSGSISGTPQAQGMYIIAISAINASGTGSATLTLTVNATGGIGGGGGGGTTVAGTSVASLRIYPNPWRKDQHAGHPITFDQMAAGSYVKIFTVSGHKVKELDGSSGSVTWDLTNDSGDQVASGIYIYFIKDSQGNKATGKLAVIR